MSIARLISLVVLAGVISAAWAAASQPGPNRWLTLVRRYGLGLIVLVALALAAGVALVLFPIAAFRTLALAGALLFGLSAVFGWSTRAALRRCVLRARWPSVARSCDLAVRRDRRPVQWPAETVMTGLAVNVIESLPVLSHGRGFAGGCTWKLTPARGGTVEAVALQAEALAAAFRVGYVEVERLNPSTGRITVYWAASPC